MQNNYQQLFDLIVAMFLKEGYEVYLKTSWMVTLRRWKLVHAIEDIKILETMINVYLDDDDNPSQVMVRYSYYERE